MSSCVSKNSKTFMSVDFTTDCPKRRLGKACKYCYVESARNMGFNAKKVCNYTPYWGEVSRFSKETIDKLNAMGGLRLFSFGDYMPEHDADITALLKDAYSVGLKIKAITKQAEFVVKYANDPAISVVHISIDNIGDGVPLVLAKSLRAQFPKTRIRAVIMKDSDIEELAKSIIVEVYTFNHARGLSKEYGWKKYSKAEVKAYSDKNGKTCCATGNCATCELKCAA